VIGVVLGLLLPCLGCWLGLRVLTQGWATGAHAVRLVLAICLGLGASALTSFWFVSTWGHLGRTFVLFDAFVWVSVCLCSTFLLRRRAVHPPPSLVEEHEESWWARWWPRIALLCAAVISLSSSALAYAAAPHGDWDAWAIWNQKARFLLRAGEDWVQGLTIGWAQPAHPLLVPASVARLWAYAGDEHTLAPALVGILCGTAAVVAVVAAVGTQHRRAWLAGALVLVPGMFVREWTAQQADVPFACFMVSSLAMLAHARRSDTNWSPAALAAGGALAGLAAWTKNEGLVLVVVTTALVAMGVVRARRYTMVAWWAAGAAPALATLAWFKLVIAPEAPYYLPEGEVSALLVERLFGSGHRTLVDSAIWQRLVAWGTPAAPGVMLATTAVACAGAFTRAGRRARVVLASVLTMAGSYYVVYLLTALDVQWLVATTFDRLLVQLWPSAVLAAALALSRDPGDEGPASTPA
jgi:hypothetical protein